MSTIAFPKPKDVVRAKRPGVKVFRDGREICDLTTVAGCREYDARLDAMWERQGGMCGLQISPLCPKTLLRRDATFDHSQGRGFSGGHRDDRVEIDGKPLNCAACQPCNLEKGSKRESDLRAERGEVLPIDEPPIAGGLGLVRYDAMILAIEACERVDEVKEIRDKARALQAYAKQAMNTDAEAKAARVRIRAERKSGELIREHQQEGKLQVRGGDRGANQHGKQATSADPSLPPKLSDLGISYDQSAQWQKLADIPKVAFDQALESAAVPSTAGVLRTVEPKPAKTPDALVEPPDADTLKTWHCFVGLHERCKRGDGVLGGTWPMLACGCTCHPRREPTYV